MTTISIHASLPEGETWEDDDADEIMEALIAMGYMDVTVRAFALGLVDEED